MSHANPRAFVGPALLLIERLEQPPGLLPFDRGTHVLTKVLAEQHLAPVRREAERSSSALRSTSASVDRRVRSGCAAGRTDFGWRTAWVEAGVRSCPRFMRDPSESSGGPAQPGSRHPKSSSRPGRHATSLDSASAAVVILGESFAARKPDNQALVLECAFERAPTLLVIAHPRVWPNGQSKWRHCPFDTTNGQKAMILAPVVTNGPSGPLMSHAGKISPSKFRILANHNSEG